MSLQFRSTLGLKPFGQNPPAKLSNPGQFWQPDLSGMNPGEVGSGQIGPIRGHVWSYSAKFGKNPRNFC